MDKQAISNDDLITSLLACVSGDACEKCIENENPRERFCYINLMRKTAEVLKQLKQKEKFHLFIWNTLGNEQMRYLVEMYREQGQKDN